MQALEQTRSPPGQVQTPALHHAPDGQAFPQTPQFWLSVLVVTQAFGAGHQVLEPLHWHWPLMQVLFDGQTLPQEPQWLKSLSPSKQPPGQARSVPEHLHCPETQVCPPAQAWPQEPQWAASVERLVQTPPQVTPGHPPPPPPPPQVPPHWQVKLALTEPLAPVSVNGPLDEKWPLMGSGLQVWQRTSAPLKFPLESTVP